MKYILMPKEPTDDMMGNLGNFDLTSEKDRQGAMDRYRGMRLLAPCPWMRIEGPETLPDDEEPRLVVFRSVTGTGYVRAIGFFEEGEWISLFSLRPFESPITHYTTLQEPPGELNQCSDSDAMIEKVAKAIWNTYPQAVLREQWEDLSISQRSEVEREARNALKAMKDPGHDITEAVVIPGDDRTPAVKNWNLMIDAALAETTSPDGDLIQF